MHACVHTLHTNTHTYMNAYITYKHTFITYKRAYVHLYIIAHIHPALHIVIVGIECTLFYHSWIYTVYKVEKRGQLCCVCTL